MVVGLMAVLAFIVNIPLGRWRRSCKKFSFAWFFWIHASVPFLIALRLWLEIPQVYIPFFIALAVLGQMMGKKLSLDTTSKDS